MTEAAPHTTVGVALCSGAGLDGSIGCRAADRPTPPRPRPDSYSNIFFVEAATLAVTLNFRCVICDSTALAAGAQLADSVEEWLECGEASASVWKVPRGAAPRSRSTKPYRPVTILYCLALMLGKRLYFSRIGVDVRLY